MGSAGGIDTEWLDKEILCLLNTSPEGRTVAQLVESVFTAFDFLILTDTSKENIVKNRLRSIRREGLVAIRKSRGKSHWYLVIQDPESMTDDQIDDDIMWALEQGTQRPAWKLGEKSVASRPVRMIHDRRWPKSLYITGVFVRRVDKRLKQLAKEGFIFWDAENQFWCING